MSLSEGDNSELVQKISEAKILCYGLQSEDKKVRKQGLIDLQKFLSDSNQVFSNADLRTIFNETHMYILKAIRDKAEAVREQAITFMSYFIIDKLPLNDYYLTYVFPVLVERIGTVELVEESEEIRLLLVQFLQSLILKYSNTQQLKPFLNDVIAILCETVKDKHPNIKELSCKCITNVAEALPRDFHLQAENLVKPTITAFSHQRYKIRVEAVKCMGDIIMHSSAKGLEEAVGPLAERLFDQIPAVRKAVAQVASRLLLEYKDRYSFWHKLLPLIITGLNDEVPETRTEAYQLWTVVGQQYERENEKDLKDQMDYLLTPPKYYPEHCCRTLVQRNISKLANALSREMASWQSDVRVRCSQLLCALALHAEEHLTQNLQEFLPAMYLAVRDEDKRVVVNVIQAAEIIGLFVSPDTWTKLIMPIIEDEAHFGNLAVLAALMRGCPREYVSPYVEEICKTLADDSICQSRKMKYQRELVSCVEAVLQKYERDESEIGRCLFMILVTVISLKDSQNDDIDMSLLDKLAKVLQLPARYDLWSKYAPYLLEHVRGDPLAWVIVTVERCIFETVLLESGAAFGENLVLIGDILEKTLDTEADAESRLKTFIALSTALRKKHEIFKNAKDLNYFLEKLVSDILVPTLVWHAGRTEEAMRSVAATCLCSALNPEVGVDLFATAEVFRPLYAKLLPLLLSLAEDASSRSRQLALENLMLLKEIAVKKNSWFLDDLLKIYPEVIKRFDDPTDRVRVCAIKISPVILEDAPEDFKKVSFKAHHELLIDTLLIHFDDDDEIIQGLILDVLKVIAGFATKELHDKIYKHKPSLRNQKGCDEVLAHLEELKVFK